MKYALALIATVQSVVPVQGSKQWRSGSIRTQETYKYGKFITRIKGDDKPGTVSSFFTWWQGDSREGWNTGGWSELDVELVPSNSGGTFYTNIIWKDQRMSGEAISQHDPATDWNTYEMQWTPDYIAWLYNGQEVRRTWSWEDPAVEFLRQREQSLRMNFWVPNFNSWRQGFNPVDMPWYSRYDFVEYWEYVPEQEWDSTNGANQYHPFKYSWRDDFNSLDESRWIVNDGGTFRENDCIFYREQTYVQNGQLVLKMEPRDGYVPGNNPPLDPPPPEGQQDNTPVYQPSSEDIVNDTVLSEDPICSMCEGLQNTVEILQRQIAEFEEILADQTSSSICF